MTKLCRELFKFENKIKLVEKIMQNVVVQSNESLCRKVDVLVWTESFFFFNACVSASIEYSLVISFCSRKKVIVSLV